MSTNENTIRVAPTPYDLQGEVKNAVGLLLDGAMRAIDDGREQTLNATGVAIAILEVLDDWDLLEEPLRVLIKEYPDYYAKFAVAKL